MSLLSLPVITNTVQWKPDNTDTKGTRQSVRIIRVSVLSGLSEKSPYKSFISADFMHGNDCFRYLVVTALMKLCDRKAVSHAK